MRASQPREIAMCRGVCPNSFVSVGSVRGSCRRRSRGAGAEGLLVEDARWSGVDCTRS